LADRGKSQEARDHHERALALAPAVAPFYTRYARFLLSTRRWAAALRLADTALEHDPRSASAFLVRSSALRAQGHLSAAEAAVREALALDPNSAAAHKALGRVHLARDEGDEAFDCFREALRLDPNDPALKRELIRSVEARLPFIGVMWRYGQSSLRHRAFWTAITALSFVWCCLTGWTNPGLALVFAVFYLFDLVWGFFVWVVDPLVTYAVRKGWVK
jgi:tetratricopeptide (TPR) repeat protein